MKTKSKRTLKRIEMILNSILFSLLLAFCFFFSILFADYVSAQFGIVELFWSVLLTGLVIQTSYVVFQLVTKKRPIHLNSRFVYWTLVFASLYYILMVLWLPVISSSVSQTIAIAISLVIAWRVLVHVRVKRSSLGWMNAALLLLLIALIVTPERIFDSANTKLLEYEAANEQYHYDSMRSAFEEINTLRESHGKNTIDWDDDVYQLAQYRASDMHERDYFDHTSPDGECPNSLKDRFGVSGIPAENIWMISGGRGNALDAINSWMDSRGHRYNLLYDDHTRGAISCEGGYCVFLGVHNGPYGLGAGGCYTGAEGTAYWGTAEKQPGEV